MGGGGGGVWGGEGRGGEERGRQNSKNLMQKSWINMYMYMRAKSKLEIGSPFKFVFDQKFKLKGTQDIWGKS